MKPYLLMLFAFFFFLLSCSADEELFAEALAENAAEQSANEEDENENSDEEEETEESGDTGPVGPIDELEINSTPCEFSLDTLEADATLELDCQIDLQGAMVVLPRGITLIFNGGEIINGGLFMNDGKIDGRLLNHSLEVDGTSELIDKTFLFYPDRWNITMGETTDQKSLDNRDNLRMAMDQVHQLKGDVFEIGSMDAYFNVQIYLANPIYQAQESILLPPDNFHLKMSEDTYMKVQPNGSPAYNLMTVFEGTNVKISGGHLIGDRWEHDYSPVNDTEGRPRNSHGWGHILKIQGGKDILIDNVYIANSTGDGFGVHGSSIRNPDGSPGNSVISENVRMTNSVVENARRNGMSILDGNGIIIENTRIINTGQGDNNPEGVYNSNGTWPKYGISFEAYRERTETGELLEYNRIENVTLRGNTFTGNEAGDIVLYTCSNITIDDNFFDSKIGNIAANSVIISNNTFKARIESDGEPYNYALNLQSNISEWDGEFTYNYDIFGNTIEGYGNAMILGGKDYKVHDNYFVNNKNGLGFENIDGGEFYGNEFYSEVPYSIAYFSRGGDLINVSVRNEDIRVEYRPINLRNINATSQPLLFETSEMISISEKANFIENSNNITITNNIINTDFTVNGSQNIVISNNQDPD